MSETIYPGASPELEAYRFTHIFPEQSVKDVVEAFRNVTVDADDFRYIPDLFSDRITAPAHEEMVDNIDFNDGKTIEQIQSESPSMYSAFCAGSPKPSVDQLRVFEEDLGPAVSALNEGPHTADLILRWAKDNRNSKRRRNTVSTYELDLLVASGIFHRSSDAVIGIVRNPKANKHDELKAKITRELLYATFDQLNYDSDHAVDAHLVAGTAITGDYCDPFHHEFDEVGRIHEQFIGATTLDFVLVGARAFHNSGLREIVGDHEQADKYRRLAKVVAQVTVSPLIDIAPKYPAVAKVLKDNYVADYLRFDYLESKDK